MDNEESSLETTIPDEAKELLGRRHFLQSMGKWSAAAPLVQSLLSRNAEGSEEFRARCLRWLLEIGERALKEGNRGEALRIVQDARAYLNRDDKIGESFANLEKQASK